VEVTGLCCFDRSSGGGGHLVHVPTLFIPKYYFGFSYLFFLTCFADGIMYYGPVV
jgi:hypothetical protein